MKVLSIAVRMPGSEEKMLPVEFGSGGFERVVAVGRDPGCNIRLTAPGVAPLHAFLEAASNHRFVEYVHSADGHEVYEAPRVDGRAFPIGPFQLRFVSAFPKTPPAAAGETRRSRWTDLFDRILGLPPLDEPDVEERVSQELAPTRMNGWLEALSSRGSTFAAPWVGAVDSKTT